MLIVIKGITMFLKVLTGDQREMETLGDQD